MARKLRAVVAGGGYHVMNRGNRFQGRFPSVVIEDPRGVVEVARSWAIGWPRSTRTSRV